MGGEDTLTNTAMFKSPVIIVALTASSLQSDRHEALAAGCNDFLTKVSCSIPFVTVPSLPDTTPAAFTFQKPKIIEQIY